MECTSLNSLSETLAFPKASLKRSMPSSAPMSLRELAKGLAKKNPTTPVSASKKRKLKRVRFRHDPLDRVQLLPAEEFDNAQVWFQQDEYDNIKAELRETLMRLRDAQGDFQCLDVEEFCIRGLEEHAISALYGREVYRNRRVVHRVLCEQSRQRMQGVSNPELLMEVSRNVTRLSTQKALMLASIDAGLEQGMV